MLPDETYIIVLGKTSLGVKTMNSGRRYAGHWMTIALAFCGFFLLRRPRNEGLKGRHMQWAERAVLIQEYALASSVQYYSCIIQLSVRASPVAFGHVNYRQELRSTAHLCFTGSLLHDVDTPGIRKAKDTMAILVRSRGLANNSRETSNRGMTGYFI